MLIDINEIAAEIHRSRKRHARTAPARPVRVERDTCSRPRVPLLRQAHRVVACSKRESSAR